MNPITRFGISENSARLKSGEMRRYWQFWYANPATNEILKESFGPCDEMSERAATYRARQRVAELNGQRVKGADAKGPALQEWCADWEEIKEAEVEESSMIPIRLSLKYLKEHFTPERRIGTIVRVEAVEFRRMLLAKKKGEGDQARRALSDASVGRIIAHSKALFQAAYDADLLNLNPFDRVQGVKSTADRAWAYVSIEVFERILAACPDDSWRGAFTLARLVGLRINEIRKCSWADFDWERRTLAVHPHATKKGTKERRRFTPLQPRAYEILRALFDQAPEKAVGPAERLPKNNLYREASPLNKILRAAQAPHSDPFHDLRRSLITDWINSGQVPEAVIVEWVGNSEKVAREFYHQVLDSNVAKITGA